MSACDFITDLLPAASIDRITLETTGGDMQTQDNPHIDEEASYTPIYDAAGVLTGYETISDKFNNSTSEALSLSVTVDLSLKEIITSGADGIISSWFGQEDFTKYFNVGVTLYTDPLEWAIVSGPMGRHIETAEATAYALSTSGTLETFSPTSYNDDDGAPIFANAGPGSFGASGMASGSSHTFYHAAHDRTYIVTAPSGSGGSFAKDFGKHKTSSVRDYINTYTGATEPAVSLSDLYNWGMVTAVSTGGTQFKLSISETFSSSDLETNPDVSFLGIIVVPSIDTTALAEDFGLPADTLDLDPRGFVSAEIISNKAISPKNPEVAILDQRDIAKLTKIELDLNPIEVTLTSGYATAPDLSYVSDVYLSHDEDGNAHGVFSVNYMDLVRDNSIYGRAIDNAPGATAAMLSHSSIEELTLFRERIDNTHTYGKEYKKETLLTTSDIIGPVAYGTNIQYLLGSDGAAVSYTDAAGSVPRARIVERKLYHTEIVTDWAPHKIRHFTFTDHEVSTFNKGEYRYSVRIKVRDGIRDYLANEISSLRSGTKELEKYYNICTQSRFYRPDLNMFKPAFKEYCENTGWPDSDERPWDVDDGPFYEALRRVVNFFIIGGTSSQNLGLDTGRPLLSPEDGTPTSIKSLLEKAQTIIALAESKIGDLGLPDNKAFQNPDALSMGPTSPYSYFEIDHEFASTHNASIPSRTGIHYVANTSPSSHGGPRFITPDNYFRAARNESSTDTTHTNHRSPQHIRMDTYSYAGGHSRISDYRDTDSDENFNVYVRRLTDEGFFTGLYRHMGNCLDQSTGGLLRYDKSSFRDIGENQSSSGLTFVSDADSLAYLTCANTISSSDETEDVATYAPPHLSVYDDEPTITDFDEIKNNLFASKNILSSDDFPDVSHYHDASIKVEITIPDWPDDHPYGMIFPTKMIEGHNDIVATAPPRRDEVKTNPDYRIAFALRYTMFVTVEYLFGYSIESTNYSTGTGAPPQRPCFNGAIWEPLSNDIIAALSAGAADENKTLLCRLVPYNQPDIGTPYPKSLCLPIYDEYFLIRNTD